MDKDTMDQRWGYTGGDAVEEDYAALLADARVAIAEYEREAAGAPDTTLIIARAARLVGDCGPTESVLRGLAAEAGNCAYIASDYAQYYESLWHTSSCGTADAENRHMAEACSKLAALFFRRSSMTQAAVDQASRDAVPRADDVTALRVRAEAAEADRDDLSAWNGVLAAEICRLSTQAGVFDASRLPVRASLPMPELDVPVLCFATPGSAWFTTCPLAVQQGRGWNLAPYQHHALEPMPWTEDMRAFVDPYSVFSIAYTAPRHGTPAERYPLHDGPAPARETWQWSVEEINTKVVPWIALLKDADCAPLVELYAGATVHEFIAAILAIGGKVVTSEDWPARRTP